MRADAGRIARDGRRAERLAPGPDKLWRSDFSLFLRKVFIKAAGYGDDALDRPIVGMPIRAATSIPATAMPSPSSRR